ncbi:hypothetical protein H096_30133 [Pseudomonas sp. FH1]|nr:hypothetical protein H096_30133 [Pseudomonas sp. FH1]
MQTPLYIRHTELMPSQASQFPQKSRSNSALALALALAPALALALFLILILSAPSNTLAGIRQGFGG